VRRVIKKRKVKKRSSGLFEREKVKKGGKYRKSPLN
jgi:hypothetical protein